ncbi:MAG: lipid-A-disaccharide synthase N-terminal domain-containing protein [Patescibacteria group bacterium]|nr:lipid-A-disaccharide synthase N-terminal domain-containing protein [Patescibacteria group bacterium]
MTGNTFMKIDFLVLFGFFAQFVFFLRFVVQWLASEKEKKSVIPMSFWYLSIIGSILILIYAVKRHDPVFSVAQFLALFIYLRNIILRKKQKD